MGTVEYVLGVCIFFTICIFFFFGQKTLSFPSNPIKSQNFQYRFAPDSSSTGWIFHSIQFKPLNLVNQSNSSEISYNFFKIAVTDLSEVSSFIKSNDGGELLVPNIFFRNKKRVPKRLREERLVKHLPLWALILRVPS